MLDKLRVLCDYSFLVNVFCERGNNNLLITMRIQKDAMLEIFSSMSNKKSIVIIDINK